jgi:hypothetical protein
MALGEKIMLSTIHDIKKSATSDVPNAKQHIELIISAIFPGYSDLCNYMDPDAYKTSDEVRSVLSRKTEEQMKSFDRIMRVIHDYNIQSAWEITPLFNGNYIKQVKNIKHIIYIYIYIYIIINSYRRFSTDVL